MVAGTVEMPDEEMDARFYEAIDKAIETEQDPVNTIRYRVLRAMQNMQLVQALRLNTEYLEKRPNDQDAQNRQLTLLADMGPVDKLIAAINEYQERDGHDTIVVQASMTYLLIGNDKDAIRAFVKTALERVGDSPFVMYQAHRALLWAGDIDGASGLSTMIQSSDLPESNRLIVRLRQACAENRLTDATRFYDRLRRDYADESSTVWISSRIMGKDQDALETMTKLDQNEDLSAIGDFLSYAYFDAMPFPNLMALLKAQGIEPREPLEIPYRCKI